MMSFRRTSVTDLECHQKRHGTVTCDSSRRQMTPRASQSLVLPGISLVADPDVPEHLDEQCCLERL